jgi:CRP/FNR family transcriptional regulator, cyclic AMP receptor protein
MASTAAMSECSIVEVERAAAIKVLHDEPAFSELFLRYILSRKYSH